MNIDNLVKMANQIGAFFESVPDRDEARREIANHLLKFWDPRMRRELMAHVERTPDNGLTDIVRESIAGEKARLG